MSALARAVPLALVAGLALAGCGALADGGADDGHRVVASFYPLAWVSEQVAGDDYDVTNLTRPGGEPHDLELGISQTADLERADLVVLLHGFQPAVDDAVTTTGGDGTVVDAGEVVDPMPLDPHFWLDPLRMAELGDAVAAALTDLDPAGADGYAARAADVRAEMERLDAAYREGLSSCRRDVVVVSHEAFGYLARYGLRFESIAGLSPDAEPTPADLGRLQELIRTEGVTTVFSERLASPAMAEALARDTGVRSAVLDPIEGPGADAAAEDYVALMEDNLAALRKANSC